MNSESPFACVATDSGLVSEILPVSPVYIRCGPPARGVFGDRRLARSRRSDARFERNSSALHVRLATTYSRANGQA